MGNGVGENAHVLSRVCPRDRCADDAIRLPDRGPDALHVPALARTGTMRKATYWEGE